MNVHACVKNIFGISHAQIHCSFRKAACFGAQALFKYYACLALILLFLFSCSFTTLNLVLYCTIKKSSKSWNWKFTWVIQFSCPLLDLPRFFTFSINGSDRHKWGIWKNDVLAQRSIHAVIKENSFFLKLLHYHQWVFSVGKVTEEDMTERGKKNCLHTML